jgi:hypothetical protein
MAELCGTARFAFTRPINSGRLSSEARTTPPQHLIVKHPCIPPIGAHPRNRERAGADGAWREFQSQQNLNREETTPWPN